MDPLSYLFLILILQLCTTSIFPAPLYVPVYTLADSIQSIVEWIDADGLEEEEAADESYGAGVEEGE